MAPPGRYNPPPNWPAPPPGWRPEKGWVPNPAWGPPPPGWPLWLPTESPGAPPTHAGFPPPLAGPPPRPLPPPSKTETIRDGVALILLAVAVFLPWSAVMAPFYGGQLTFTILIPLALVSSALTLAVPRLTGQVPTFARNGPGSVRILALPALILVTVAIAWDLVGGALAVAGVGLGGPGVGPGALCALAATVVITRPRFGAPAASPLHRPSAPRLALTVGFGVATASLVLSLIAAAVSPAPGAALVITALGGVLGPALLGIVVFANRATRQLWRIPIISVGTGGLIGSVVLAFTPSAAIEQFGGGWDFALFAWVLAGAVLAVADLPPAPSAAIPEAVGSVVRAGALIAVWSLGSALLYAALAAFDVAYIGTAAAVVEAVFGVLAAGAAAALFWLGGPRPGYQLRVLLGLLAVLVIMIVRLIVVATIADVVPLPVMDLTMLVVAALAAARWVAVTRLGRSPTVPAPPGSGAPHGFAPPVVSHPPQFNSHPMEGRR